MHTANSWFLEVALLQESLHGMLQVEKAVLTCQVVVLYYRQIMGNNFEGNVPPEIFNMSNLEHL